MKFTELMLELELGNTGLVKNFMSQFDIRLFMTRLPNWQDNLALQKDADLNRN